MTRWISLTGRLPAWISAAVVVILAFYGLPHLTYFSYSPVLLLSEDAARSLQSMSGPERDRSFNRLMTKNVQGVVFREETLTDLESAGRAFVASGEELLRLFKLQSVASYYVFEQVRDKKLKPEGSYVFFSEAALFERVFEELKRRLPHGSVVVYERGIFRGDASFPDNFILESSLPPEKLRNISMGWPVERIRNTLGSLQPQRGDTLWPVLWNELTSPGSAPPAPDVVPGSVYLESPIWRFPFDSIRIVHDPLDLISFQRSSDLENLLAVPLMDTNLPLILAILVILASCLSLSRWTIWAPLAAAILLVIALTLLPTQKDWVLGGVTGILPIAALFSWMAASDTARAARSREEGSIFRGSAWLSHLWPLMIFLVPPGWLLAVLFWQRPDLPLANYAAYGLLVVPVLSTALFLAVWGIEVSNRPIYPRHIRTGVEAAAVMAILFWCVTGWILFLTSILAWSRWLVVLDRTRGRTLEDAPGNYAAFFAASALSLKIFFASSPLSAAVLLAVSFGSSSALATIWLTRTSRA